MWCAPNSGGNILIKGKVASTYTVCAVRAVLRLQLKRGKALKMVLSDYAKIRILTLWRAGLGPTVIAELLERDEGIRTTRKSVSLFIAR